MKKINESSMSRRAFIGTSSTLVTGLVASNTVLSIPNIIRNFNKPNSLINGVQIGLITYSFRSLPDQTAEATLKYVLDTGVSAIELMGDPVEVFAGKPESKVDRRKLFQLRRAKNSGETLTELQLKELDELLATAKADNEQLAKWRASVPMDKFKQVKQMYKAAGVQIYAFKPSAFGKENTDAEMDYGFRVAKVLGASHITLEHPSDDTHTMKLGKMAAKHKISVGYHGHEQQTTNFWDTALQQSKFNGLNLDLGHYIAAGNTDAISLIQAKHQHILSMHIKDRTTPANGKKNLFWGTGDTPLQQVLQLMRDQKYKFPATIELEYEIPKDSDAVKEVAKCVEYCRKALQR